MCQVTSITRTNCKRCRYIRCLEVGMRPELVDATLKRKQEERRRQELVVDLGGGHELVHQESHLQQELSPLQMARGLLQERQAQKVLQAVQEIQHPHQDVTPHLAVTAPETILGYSAGQPPAGLGDSSSNMLLQALEGRRKVLLELRGGVEDKDEGGRQLSANLAASNTTVISLPASVGQQASNLPGLQITPVEPQGDDPPRAHQPLRQQTYYIFHPASQTFEPITIAEFEENAVIEEVVVAEDYSLTKEGEEENMETAMVASEHDYNIEVGQRSRHSSREEKPAVFSMEEMERKPVISSMFQETRGGIKLEGEPRVHTSVIKRTGHRLSSEDTPVAKKNKTVTHKTVIDIIDSNGNSVTPPPDFPPASPVKNSMSALNTDLGRVIEETIGENLGKDLTEQGKQVRDEVGDSLAKYVKKGSVDIESLVEACFEEELGRVGRSTDQVRSRTKTAASNEENIVRNEAKNVRKEFETSVISLTEINVSDKVVDIDAETTTRTETPIINEVETTVRNEVETIDTVKKEAENPVRDVVGISGWNGVIQEGDMVLEKNTRKRGQDGSLLQRDLDESLPQRDQDESLPKRGQDGSLLPLKKRRKMHHYPISMAINRHRVPRVGFTIEEEFRIHDLIARRDHIEVLAFQHLLAEDEGKVHNMMAVYLNFAETGDQVVFKEKDMEFSVKAAREFFAVKSQDVFDEFNVLKRNIAYRCQFNAWPAVHSLGMAFFFDKREKGLKAQFDSSPVGKLYSSSSLKKIWPGLMNKLAEMVPNSRGVDLADYNMFKSPWAQSLEDETFFEDTIRKLGDVLGDDCKLVAVYQTLLMSSQPPGARLNSNKNIKELQGDLGQLLYRYLVNTVGDVELAANKAYTLVGFLDKLHRCGDIWMNKRIKGIE